MLTAQAGGHVALQPTSKQFYTIDRISRLAKDLDAYVGCVSLASRRYRDIEPPARSVRIRVITVSRSARLRSTFGDFQASGRKYTGWPHSNAAALRSGGTVASNSTVITLAAQLCIVPCKRRATLGSCPLERPQPSASIAGPARRCMQSLMLDRRREEGVASPHAGAFRMRIVVKRTGRERPCSRIGNVPQL